MQNYQIFSRTPLWKWLFILAITLLACAPEWLVTFHIFPASALDLIVLFGKGDVQYIPNIVSLARFDLSPSFSSLFEGTGVMAPPFLAFLPHAAFFNAFGTWGFLLVEALLTVALALALIVLFKRFELPWHLVALGVFVAFFAIDISKLMQTASVPQTVVDITGHLQLYGKRFVRPLLSNPVVILYLIIIHEFWMHPMERIQSKKFAALIGIWSSLLLQVHAFDFIGLFLAPVLVYAINLFFIRHPSIHFGTFAITAVIAFLTASSPFLLQLSNVGPDLKQRYGFFTVPDLQSHMRAGLYVLRNQLGALTTIAVVLPLIMASLIRSHRSTLQSLAIFGTAGLLGPVAYGFLSPSLTQIYHFVESGRLIAGIVLLTCLLIGILKVVELSQKKASSGVKFQLATTITLGVMFIVLGNVKLNNIIADTEAGGPRRDLFPVASPRSLKQDWIAMSRSVSSKMSVLSESSRPLLLLTNDQTTLYWWLLHYDGNLLLPDVSTVVLTTDQVEYQMCQAGKIMGWTADEWVDFFSVPSLDENRGRLMNGEQIWFHGHNKYHAFELHSFSALEDYAPEYQEKISTEKSSWQVVLPQSERKRLIELYERIELNTAALPDVIVWIKRGESALKAQPKGPYQRLFENRNYIVWERLTTY